MRPNRNYTGLQRTPQSLSWLLRERAVVRGLLDKRKKQLASLPLEICDLLDSLASLDRVIRMHDVPVEPSVIEGKAPQSTSIYKGKRMTSAILDCFKASNGRILSTDDVTYGVVEKCGLKIADFRFTQLRDPVRKMLGNLVARGKLVRNHNPQTTDQGRWSLPAGDV